MPVQPPPSRRRGPSAMDLLRSLLPLVALILVMVWLYSPAEVDPVREIDPGSDLAYAASIADFDVLGAGDLPEGWRPTSSRVEPATEGGPVGVSVGYVTPSQEFARVVHSSLPEVRLLTEVLGEGYAEGGVTADGWRGFRTADGEQALVRSEEGSTVIVTGSAAEAELRVLAGALRPIGG
ncbi:MAG: DUF4245 domain-containing protein [Geodermatophilaceae bacterium]